MPPATEDANPNPHPRRNLTHGERHHLGGRVETDTVAMAAGIQRRHRLERRHGDDPSQTPQVPILALWLLATRYLKA
jgi:hypothetical protein